MKQAFLHGRQKPEKRIWGGSILNNIKASESSFIKYFEHFDQIFSYLLQFFRTALRADILQNIIHGCLWNRQKDTRQILKTQRQISDLWCLMWVFVKQALHYPFNWIRFLEMNKLRNVIMKKLRFSTNQKLIPINWNV